MRRVAVHKNPFLGDRRFLDEILQAFLSLQRTLQRIEKGEIDVPDDTWRTYSDVHEIAAVYLGLAGCRQARRALLDTMWTMARQPGVTGSAIGRRAFGLAMLAPTDWPENSEELVYPDMLIVADCSADRVLLRGVAEPRREIHDDGIDNDRAGLHRVPPGPTLDRLIRQSLAEPLGKPGVVVFPKSILDSIGKGENKREAKAILADALGAELPLVPVPEDWDAWERDRVAAFPWAFRAIRAFRTAQAGRSHFGLAVLCLHGSPGCGKSALARELAESCGLKFVRYQADSASENSYGGTSVRWQSGHLGVAEAAVAGEKKATVCISHDEIEKAAGTRKSNGGSLHDTLHGAWEPETSRSWHSPFLLHAVDISHLVYIPTANSVSALPNSLRDRMTLVEVPEPSAEHLSILAPRVAQELCRQRGLDEGWASFDSIEWESLREGWKGGSIRSLQACVELVFRVRDELPLAARGPLN
ncbi:AAA family ATPase [Methylobacterium sp. J-090]|uniref:AAA family ATPase n=1 Tax=Methylobacterium sp. J-090 TaxID=2836666 RepID=UPI001FBB0BAD|nr:AAA family ATPase [Methylobacterium sp. J-090]MCJ2084207.1 AAA family ATPase [Methylobacterium sp. J-090]